MGIVFETRRLYVAPRKSVLFFAKVGDHRVRCYVEEDALIEGPRALREESDPYQRCLLAFDRHKDLIQAVARRLLEAKGDDLDGALIVSGSVLALAPEAPAASGGGEGRCAGVAGARPYATMSTSWVLSPRNAVCWSDPENEDVATS